MESGIKAKKGLKLRVYIQALRLVVFPYLDVEFGNTKEAPEEPASPFLIVFPLMLFTLKLPAKPLIEVVL